MFIRWSIACGFSLFFGFYSIAYAGTAPDSVSAVVVPPAQVELALPILGSRNFVFSADASSLVFARSRMVDIKQIGDVVHDGPIAIDELTLLKLTAKTTAQTLVSADFTKQFAVYGAYIGGIAWHGDNIQFVVSNGDDASTELTYSLPDQRLVDEKGRDVSEEPDALTEALRQSIQSCFAEFPDTVIYGGFRQHLPGSDYAIFQVQAQDYPNDIWLVNKATCHRTRINVDALTANKPIRLLHAILSQGTLSLVVRRSMPQFEKTLIWQTPLRQVLANPVPPVWREWSAGIPRGGFDVRSLGSALSHPLLLLESRHGDCDDLLLSVGSSRVEHIQVDGYALCDATAHPDGKLALSMYRYKSLSELKEHLNKLQANQLLQISAQFTQSLAN